MILRQKAGYYCERWNLSESYIPIDIGQIKPCNA